MRGGRREVRGCGIFVATRSQQTRLVGCGGQAFPRDPVGIQPQELRDFFWPHSAK